MFAELYKTNNVIILDGRTKEPKNIVSRVLRKIHLSRKINSIVQLPFKRIWARTPLTFKQPIENEEYCVLFIDNIPQFIDFSLLNLAREKYGIKIVLFLLNPVGLFEATTYNLSNFKFDKVFSYDHNDVKKYGFSYLNIPYSMASDRHLEIEYDLYAVFWDKGRLSLFHDIFDRAKKRGITVRARITGVPNERQFGGESIVYAGADYDGIIEETKKANCILDMLSPGHAMVSTRYYEAVCYNIKLLTNNLLIKELPFYDPRYIQIFDKPEDINWEWVRERSEVSFNYDGSFSPLKMLETIETELKANK